MDRERSHPRRAAVLAVDGGGSKADAVLLDRHGSLLGKAHRLGRSDVDMRRLAIDPLVEVVDAACLDAGLSPNGSAVATVGMYCLAGADFPLDERRIGRMLDRLGRTERTLVRNDTFAVLRVGSERGWGVAVVCGAGLNCLGIGPDGRTVRFPALGELSGDLAAGGEWVGIRALAAAVRARDGRGERTALEGLVPHHFGMGRPETVMNAIYRGRVGSERLMELAPVVVRAALSGDAVARNILNEQAGEVALMATATIRRLRLSSTDVDVILGGGMFQADDPEFLRRVENEILRVAPSARIAILRVPPIVGAALLGLDELGAPASASSRVREEIDHATIDHTIGRRSATDRSSRGL